MFWSQIRFRGPKRFLMNTVEQKTSVEQKCMGFRRTKIGQQCRQTRLFYDRDSIMYRYLSENILLTKLYSVEQKSFRNHSP